MVEQLVDVPKIVVELEVSSGEVGSSGPGERASERDTTDAADTAFEVPVGEARPLGILQYSAATASEVGGSSGEAGSSWPGADDTTLPDDATVAKAVGGAWPPGIAEHGVTTASALAVSSGEAGSARPGAEQRAHPVPLMQQSQWMLIKLGLLESQS